MFIVNIPINSLMSAVLPLKALIVLPNKLVLLVDRVLVHLQVLLCLYLTLLLLGHFTDAANDDSHKHKDDQGRRRQNSKSLEVT